MTTRTWLLMGAALGATGALYGAGCDRAFDGPYPCAPGFASCTTTSSCETLLMSDGTSCGACGKQCSPGAACSGGTCGEAALFESTMSPGFVQVAGKSLAWAPNATTSASLDVVSTRGGTPAVVAGSLLTCGAGAPFAIDGANVYYFSSNTTSGPTSGGTLVAQALGAGTGSGTGSGGSDAGMASCATLASCCASAGPDQQVCDSVVSAGNPAACASELVTAHLNGVCQKIGSGGQDAGAGGSPTVIASMTACGALVVHDGTLYIAGSATNVSSGPSSTTFYSIPTRGGTPTSLATVSDWSGGSFAVSAGSIYFNAGCAPDGQCNVLGTVPITGGPVTYTSGVDSNSNASGQGPVAADANNVYAVMGGWDCNENDNGNNGNGNNGNANGSGCGQSGQACCTGSGVQPCAMSGVACSADGICPSPELASSVLASVVAFPVNGAAPVVVTTTHDGSPVTGMAVDASNVYWVTSTTAWAVPVGGGTAVAIAGNLGTPPTPCSNGDTTQITNAATIASDGTNVYIASPSRSAIYRVPVPK